MAASTSLVEQTHPHLKSSGKTDSTASGGGFLGQYLHTQASEMWGYRACTAQGSFAVPEQNASVRRDKPWSLLPGEVTRAGSQPRADHNFSHRQFNSRASQPLTSLSVWFNYV